MSLELLISALARLYGPTQAAAKDLLKHAEAKRKGYGDREIAKRKLDEKLFVTPQSIRTSLMGFYATTATTLKPYSFTAAGRTIATSMFVREDFVNARVSPAEITMRLSNAANPVPKHQWIDYALEVAARISSMGIPLWDSNLFRLVTANSKPFEFEFDQTSFFSYRFTSGLLADELADALIDSKGNLQPAVIHQLLPVRSTLIPDLTALERHQTRICCGGVGVVFALKRKDDYFIPLQVRSNKVSDGRELTAVVPKAFHESIGVPNMEANIHWTIFRELFEELFAGVEAEKDSIHASHDWFFDKHPGLKWFESNDGYRCEITGFGYNAMSGNYEFSILLAVCDDEYEHQFRRSMIKSWEFGSINWVSSKDKRQLTEVLCRDTWASESLFHFVEGLRRLRQIDPKRVELPDGL